MFFPWWCTTDDYGSELTDRKPRDAGTSTQHLQHILRRPHWYDRSIPRWSRLCAGDLAIRHDSNIDLAELQHTVFDLGVVHQLAVAVVIVDHFPRTAGTLTRHLSVAALDVARGQGSAHERFFGEVLRFGVNLESRVVALTHDLEYATQIG